MSVDSNFIVFKREDIEKYLGNYGCSTAILLKMASQIKEGRIKEGLKPFERHVVEIRTDFEREFVKKWISNDET